MLLPHNDAHVLERAKVLHQLWVAKFQFQIATMEPLNLPTLIQGDASDLGKWLNSDGKLQFKYWPGFVVVVEAHRRFHRIAAMAAGVMNETPPQERLTALHEHSEFFTASAAVIDALSQLQNSIQLRSDRRKTDRRKGLR